MCRLLCVYWRGNGQFMNEKRLERSYCRLVITWSGTVEILATLDGYWLRAAANASEARGWLWRRKTMAMMACQQFMNDCACSCAEWWLDEQRSHDRAPVEWCVIHSQGVIELHDLDNSVYLVYFTKQDID